MKPEPRTVAPHPAARRTKLVLGAMAATAGLLGVLAFAFGIWIGGMIGLGGAGLGLYAIRFLDRQLKGVRIANAAFQLLTRGRLDEAEALLGTIPAHGNVSVVERAAASQRAIIALERGQLDEAIRQATIAADGRLGVGYRSFKRSQRAGALGLRGLALAAKGELDAAERDAAGAEAILEASPDALARAGVVRALALSRRGDPEVLAAYLRDSGPMLLDHAEPKERAIVRALARMTRAKGRSVYREPGRTTDEEDPTKLASFVAMLAPEAAAYADERRPLAEHLDAQPESSAASAAQVDAIRRVRSAPTGANRRRARRVLALWAVLIVMFLTIWQVLTPTGRPAPTPGEIERERLSRPPPGESTFPEQVVYAAGLVVFGAVLGGLALRRSREKKFFRACRMVTSGDVTSARKMLWPLVASPNAITGAIASYHLACIEAAEGAFANAIGFCEKAITRVGVDPIRDDVSDLLLPGLMTELAVSLAAAGRPDEATAEATLLAQDFPDYAFLAASQLRVRLVRAARDGDWAAAASAARARTPELPIPRREELLADLALAATGAVSEDERERLAAELADDRMRTWIDAVAPGLRGSLLYSLMAQRTSSPLKCRKTGYVADL